MLTQTYCWTLLTKQKQIFQLSQLSVVNNGLFAANSLWVPYFANSLWVPYFTDEVFCVCRSTKFEFAGPACRCRRLRFDSVMQYVKPTSMWRSWNLLTAKIFRTRKIGQNDYVSRAINWRQKTHQQMRERTWTFFTTTSYTHTH